MELLLCCHCEVLAWVVAEHRRVLVDTDFCTGCVLLQQVVLPMLVRVNNGPLDDALVWGVGRLNAADLQLILRLDAR